MRSGRWREEHGRVPATLRRRDTGYEVVAAGRDGDAAVLESSGPAAGGASGELRRREPARPRRELAGDDDARRYEKCPEPGSYF